MAERRLGRQIATYGIAAAAAGALVTEGYLWGNVHGRDNACDKSYSFSTAAVKVLQGDTIKDPLTEQIDFQDIDIISPREDVLQIRDGEYRTPEFVRKTIPFTNKGRILTIYVEQTHSENEPGISDGFTNVIFIYQCGKKLI